VSPIGFGRKKPGKENHQTNMDTGREFRNCLRGQNLLSLGGGDNNGGVRLSKGSVHQNTRKKYAATQPKLLAEDSHQSAFNKAGGEKGDKYPRKKSGPAAVIGKSSFKRGRPSLIHGGEESRGKPG